jgi:hypothetical protein
MSQGFHAFCESKNSCLADGKSTLRHIHGPLYAMLKKPTAQIAHLVFADTQANAEKPKELFFCQRSTEKI